MGRRRMPTGNSQGKSSRMASGKRASMREGPLAALFRKTEEEGLDEAARSGASARPEPDPAHPQPQELPPRRQPPEPDAAERPGARKPVDRLRDVFSSDIPENMLERQPVRPSGDELRPRYGREEPNVAAVVA